MMDGVQEMTESLMLEILERLNQIGEAVIGLGGGNADNVKPTLELIVQSATELVPGSSAVIYTYDHERKRFDPRSRVSSERYSRTDLDDYPRPDGLGVRAVMRGCRVLSYEERDVTINPAKVEAGAKAMVCYPLMTAQVPLGVLYVYLHEDRPFADLELLMLENFVHLTAMTLSLARQISLSQQEQARKDRELRRLRRAGMLLSSRSSLKETLDTILNMALEITDATYGIFRLVDASGTKLEMQSYAGIGLAKPATEALPLDENSIMGMVGVRREPVVISDLREEPWRHIYYPFDRELEMRSEVAVPLVGASGRLEGVLNLESPLVNAFDRQDRYLLQILATQAVTAIQEARLLAALEEAAALLSTQPAQVVHRALVERACNLLNAPVCAIWLIDGGILVSAAASSPGLLNQRIPLADCAPMRSVVESRKAVFLEDISFGSAWKELGGLVEGGNGILVPLLPGKTDPAAGVFGVFTTPQNRRDFAGADWDKKVLEILSRYAALAVQNERRQEALRNAQERQITNEAFAAVGDVAANLLHRLNNKIGVIPVRVEGIQDKCEEALMADSYLAVNLQEIRRSAEEAMEVVRENLFHLHPIHLAPVTVLDAVEEALTKTQLPPGVKVEMKGLKFLPAVQAGQKRLPLVFANLLENAVDAMKGEGVITIEGSRKEHWVEVAVSDSGSGIPPELHEKIFEFNYSGRRTYPGKLGFGLWWVKSLVTRFGGSVSVQSDGKHGTIFLIKLPLAKEEG